MNVDIFYKKYLESRTIYTGLKNLHDNDDIKKCPYEHSGGTNEKSLYERLGGIYAIAAVIDHFSDALIKNPVVGQSSSNPQLSEWHTKQLGRLPGLKWMRTLWVASISGGPFNFVSTVPEKCPFSLEGAHCKFKISPEEFDVVAKILADTLDHFKVPKKEKDEVLAAFSGHKNEVNMGYYKSKDTPANEIKCLPNEIKCPHIDSKI